ncbi:hypothetical protein, partial [Candidatus Litorirhabdus singularis]|uniref:hypothetical protein n=1 Tax=Candidatus Litorirhabdus singularis TaxID=2518993 RepID=UPI00242F6688
DLGDGQASDHDVFYAGQGNDDLIGGSGTNDLYAWSRDPELGGQFGVFVDANGTLRDTDGNGLYTLEDTGLNRMLGGSQADQLFGGTGLDFLYGNGGDDVLYRRDGQSFDTLDGDQVEGDEWKEYARASTEVWYYGGTNANDVITVDFVTEPGLLGDHHLITRLTEVNGNFSFDATVRLDFQATDSSGNLIWEARRLLNLVEDPLTGLQTEAAPSLNGLLPAEGDFQVIIIDALGGNDQIIVGPTVQKSVWVDAGAGDDRVTILGGTSILADKAELGTRNDSAAFAHDLGSDLTLPAGGSAQYLPDQTEANAPTPYSLGTIEDLVLVQGLTLHTPGDVDLFEFTLAAVGGVEDVIRVARTSVFDGELSVRLLDASGTDIVVPLTVVGLTSSISLSGLSAGTYRLEIQFAETVTDPAAYLLGPQVGTDGKRVLNLGVPGPDIIAATTFSGLTLDSAVDVDYYRFRLGFDGQLLIDDAVVVVSVTELATGQAVDPLSLNANTEYLLSISSPDLVPAVYSLTFAPLGSVDTPLEIDLAQHSLNERRDIVLGGDGNDVLSGG